MGTKFTDYSAGDICCCDGMGRNHPSTKLVVNYIPVCVDTATIFHIFQIAGCRRMSRRTRIETSHPKNGSEVIFCQEWYSCFFHVYLVYRIIWLIDDSPWIRGVLVSDIKHYFKNEEIHLSCGIPGRPKWFFFNRNSAFIRERIHA